METKTRLECISNASRLMSAGGEPIAFEAALVRRALKDGLVNEDDVIKHYGKVTTLMMLSCMENDAD
jgi:hypothetical protein